MAKNFGLVHYCVQYIIGESICDILLVVVKGAKMPRERGRREPSSEKDRSSSQSNPLEVRLLLSSSIIHHLV